MPDKKEIVLLIAAFGRQDAYIKTLESVAASSDIIDVVVVDDCSISPIVIDSRFESFVKIIRADKNVGVERASNIGLEYIFTQDYKYIACIDVGDFATNDRFTKEYNFFQSHPDHAIVGSWRRNVDLNGKVLSLLKHPKDDEQIRNLMHINSTFSNPSVMMRAELAKKVGFYNPSFPTAHDYDYHFRIMKFGKGANIEEFLLDYESGNPDSISNSKRLMQVISRLKIQLKYFEPCNFYSYWGVIRTLLIFAIPYKLICILKNKKSAKN